MKDKKNAHSTHNKCKELWAWPKWINHLLHSSAEIWRTISLAFSSWNILPYLTLTQCIKVHAYRVIMLTVAGLAITALATNCKLDWWLPKLHTNSMFWTCIEHAHKPQWMVWYATSNCIGGEACTYIRTYERDRHTQTCHELPFDLLVGICPDNTWYIWSNSFLWHNVQYSSYTEMEWDQVLLVVTRYYSEELLSHMNEFVTLQR